VRERGELGIVKIQLSRKECAPEVLESDFNQQVGGNHAASAAFANEMLALQSYAFQYGASCLKSIPLDFFAVIRFADFMQFTSNMG
jgi:hypothetical protein